MLADKLIAFEQTNISLTTYNYIKTLLVKIDTINAKRKSNSTNYHTMPHSVYIADIENILKLSNISFSSRGWNEILIRGTK